MPSMRIFTRNNFTTRRIEIFVYITLAVHLFTFDRFKGNTLVSQVAIWYLATEEFKKNVLAKNVLERVRYSEI